MHAAPLRYAACTYMCVYVCVRVCAQQLLGYGGTSSPESPEFLEALLGLVGALALTTPGGQVLMDAGIIQMLLSMLDDHW